MPVQVKRPNLWEAPESAGRNHTLRSVQWREATWETVRKAAFGQEISITSWKIHEDGGSAGMMASWKPPEPQRQQPEAVRQ